MRISDLSLMELRLENLSRSNRWHPNGTHSWSLSDWGVAAAGEMGEALNIIKKLNRERDGMKGNSLTVDQLRGALADELADVVIYTDILASTEGIDLSAAIVSKFNRTSMKCNFPERIGSDYLLITNDEKCSCLTPHRAHVWNGRPAKYCEGVK